MTDVDEARDGIWWVDDPIEAAGEDKLGRRPFVDRVIRLLDLISRSQSSAVLALVGPWGSGKTSTVRMILSGLDRGRWCVAYTNPWALSGPDAVVADVLAAVGASLPRKGRAATRARRALVRYGTFAAPLLSVIPLVGQSAKDVSQAVLSRLAGESTIQQLMQEATAELDKLNRPVLVVIDDVDRLQPDELLALFKAVRVLGRLPHVHYLLAYDEQTVLDVLRTTATASPRDGRNEDRALLFLEKIITLRLDQPPTLPEQTAAIFESGLTHVLSCVGAVITEDQRRRFADEREALLSPMLTEPRSIARFLGQLRAYLPLVGPSEIDIVDFMILAFLRVNYPSLYKALSVDQDLLVGAVDPDRALFGDERLESWGTEHLEQLGVPQPVVPRVWDALQRLFPLLGGQPTAARILDRDTRRRDRRASDPDHVGRYFALVPLEGDLPDVVLTAALDEWVSGQPGESARQLEVILRPNAYDSAACALAARVLRRAEARTESMLPEKAAALLPVVLNLLPLPETDGLRGSPEDAAVGLLAQLVAKANGPAPAQLLNAIERPPNKSSALWSLLRALSLVVPNQPRDVRLPRSHQLDEQDSGPWLAQLLKASTEAVWQRFVGQCQLDAETSMEANEPAGSLIRWLDQIEGADETNRRLVEAIDGGLPIIDVAAYMVELEVDVATERTELVGLDGAGAIRRLGRERVTRQLTKLSAYVEGAKGASPIDTRDLTWTSRRRVAAAGLLAALHEPENIPIRRLPVIPDLQYNPLLNTEPNVLDVPGGEQPDLRGQIGVLVSASDRPPAFAPLIPSPTAQEREHMIVEMLADSSLTTWLTNVASSWHVTPRPWNIIDSDGQVVTRAATSGWSDDEARAEWWQQTPIRIGVQFTTGPSSDPRTGDAAKPALLLTASIGVWLAELTSDRQAADRRHTESPLPAALSLGETYVMLRALTDSIDLSQNAITRLLNSDSADLVPLVNLTIDAHGGLASVVDLSEIDRIGTSVRSQHRSAGRVGQYADANPSKRLRSWKDEFVIGALNTWLQQSGYRGYEQKLWNLYQEASA